MFARIFCNFAILKSIIVVNSYYNGERLWMKIRIHPNERQESLEILGRLRTSIGDTLKSTMKRSYDHIHSAIKNNLIQRDVFGLNPILHALRTAQIAVDEIGLKRDGVFSDITIYECSKRLYATADEIKDKFGDNVAHN